MPAMTYAAVVSALEALDEFDDDMVLKHDLSPVINEVLENDAERPALLIRDGGASGNEEFPREIGYATNNLEQGVRIVEVDLYFPVTDDSEEWEEDRQATAQAVYDSLKTFVNWHTRLSWTGWRAVPLDGTASPSYTKVTYRLRREKW